MPRLGTCLCENVQYELTDEPLNYFLCHCNNCRKSSGSTFMSHTLWNPDQLQITKGESYIRHYVDRDTDSGNKLTRSFCTNCGSSLFVKPSKERFNGDFIIVAPTTIEGSHVWAPKKEVYTRNKVEWLRDMNPGESQL